MLRWLLNYIKNNDLLRTMREPQCPYSKGD
jgi:hypothetical protein